MEVFLTTNLVTIARAGRQAAETQFVLHECGGMHQYATSWRSHLLHRSIRSVD